MGSLEQRLARLEARAGPPLRAPVWEAERARRFDGLFEELEALGAQRGEPSEDPVGDLLTMIETHQKNRQKNKQNRRNGDAHDDQDR